MTGATGFIGKALLTSLIENKHYVRAVARDEEKLRELQTLGAEAISGSLEEVKKEWLADIDIVYHLGAIRYEWGFSKHEYKKINVEATQEILKYSEEFRVKRFVFGSTVFVFGSPRKLPIDETFPYAPESLYAKSKMEAEKIVKRISAEKKFPATIVRPTITYGPGDTKGMLLKLCRLIKNDKFFMIGSGKNLLHLTYIDDIVSGFEKALGDNRQYNDYNLASREPIELRKLVALIASLLEKKIWPGHFPVAGAKCAGLISELVFRSGKTTGLKYFRNEPIITRSKVNILTANRVYAIKKAKEHLGYTPRINYPEGVRRTIMWYKKNGYL